MDSFTFEVVSGPTTASGPTDSFQLAQGNSVTAAAPGIGVIARAELLLTFTGGSAGDRATGSIVVRSALTGESWTVSLAATTIEPGPGGIDCDPHQPAKGARDES